MLEGNRETLKVLNQIAHEREAQNRKWGEQNHEPTHWLAILLEEVGEVAKDVVEYKAVKSERVQRNHLDNARIELIQVAAVAVAMIESLDRKRDKEDYGD